MSVDVVRVREVLRLERRSVEVDARAEYREIGVRSFGKGIFHKDPITGDQLGAKRVFKVEPGDLVLSNVFAWEGAVALAGHTERGMIGSHRFMTYVPRDERILPAWAAWFFVSERGLGLLGAASPGSAGRNRTLAIERFENLEIPLPRVQTQEEVAVRLGTLYSHLDELRDRLGHGVAEIKRALPLLIDEVLEHVAVGTARVGDLVEFVSDTVHPGDDPHPADRFVGLQHIEGHTGRRTGSDPLTSMKGRKFRFRPGDLVYGYLRPYLNKVWIADCDGLCSVDQYVLRARDGVNAELLAYALRGRAVLDAAVTLTHSLQLPRLRSGLLAGIEVPAVPHDLVDETLARLRNREHRVLEIDTRRERQTDLAAAVFPAALNAEFGAYR